MHFKIIFLPALLFLSACGVSNNTSSFKKASSLSSSITQTTTTSSTCEATPPKVEKTMKNIEKMVQPKPFKPDDAADFSAYKGLKEKHNPIQHGETIMDSYAARTRRNRPQDILPLAKKESHALSFRL